MRVLLTEADSLTARETVTVLGPAGHELHLMAATAAPIARFSRWCHALHRAPASGADPVGYFAALGRAVRDHRIEAVLATHEQAYLAARHPEAVPPGLPLIRAGFGQFRHVQGKAAFARTCDQLGLPQPDWSPVEDPADLGAVGFPCWLKAEFSTAGRGVRFARNGNEARAALSALGGIEAGVMVQAPAPGRYAQAAGLFDHGRLIALHCSEQIGRGVGGSAAARVGVVHPEAGRAMARLGAALAWHGGLTLDYLHDDGAPLFIECNPRTVEPGNAAASEVDLPALTLALTTGAALPSRPVVGRPGVRTRSTIALMLGAAEASGRRRAVAGVARAAIGHAAPFRSSREVLTPVLRDPPSAVPAALVTGALLARPGSYAALAGGAIKHYAGASRPA